ncbi:MAG: DUF167 domain-containing protein [bacterium]|nr:DUF167 domain-containing protein [bacterium]
MKLINIRVIPNAKKNNVSEQQGKLKVHISAPAVDGKANKALIKVLAEYFKIKKNNIRIIRGTKSREKVVEIPSS